MALSTTTTNRCLMLHITRICWCLKQENIRSCQHFVFLITWTKHWFTLTWIWYSLSTSSTPAFFCKRHGTHELFLFFSLGTELRRAFLSFAFLFLPPRSSASIRPSTHRRLLSKRSMPGISSHCLCVIAAVISLLGCVETSVSGLWLDRNNEPCRGHFVKQKIKMLIMESSNILQKHFWHLSFIFVSLNCIPKKSNGVNIYINKNVRHCEPLILDTVAITLHLGHASWKRRPHLLGCGYPTSPVQQRCALLEILPRVPQAAEGWPSKCMCTSSTWPMTQFTCSVISFTTFIFVILPLSCFPSLPFLGDKRLH